MASPDPPFKVRAIFDYESAHGDDLNFVAGETITVTSVEDADWYYGEYTDKASGAKKQGIFPMNFVERLVAEVPARPSRTRKAPEPEPVTEAPAVRAPSPVPTPVAPQPIAPQPPQTPAPTYKQEEPHVPKQQPVKPSSPEPVKQKPPPPPPAEKSAGVASSFRDRIAAFNKQAEAQAPVKPAAPWGAAGPKTSFVKKPFVAPPPSKNAYIPPIVSHVPKPRRDEDVSRDVTEPTSPTPTAEDEPPAKISTLKDRIAALQHMQLDPAGKPKPKPPKPKPRTESESSATGPTLVAEQVQAASALPEEEEDGLESVGKEPVAVRNVELEDAIQTKDIINPEQSAISARVKKSVEMRRTAAGAGDEGAESAGDADVSSSGGHDIEVPRPKAPAGKAARHGQEKDDDGDDEGANDGQPESPDEEEAEKEEEGEKEEIDPEVARRLAIRERMKKMSGCIGMHGMVFGGSPGMGMPKKKAPESRASGESERREEEQRPVPAMVPIFPMGGFVLPGMKHPAPKQPDSEVPEVTGPESEEKVASSTAMEKMLYEHTDEDIFEDLKFSGQSKAAESVPLTPTSPIGSPQMRPMERAPPPPPPAPQERPAPPAPPLSDRPPPPPPHAHETHLAQPTEPIIPSATEGSESDDEASEVNTGTLSISTTSIAEARGLPPPPPNVTSPTSPTSSKRQSYYTSTQMSPPPAQVPISPTTPGISARRTSYIRGSTAPPIPVMPPVTQTSPPAPRPPPPPPPTAPPRQSGEMIRGGRSDTEGEYEADYDTDLANKDAHKDALKAHHHHHHSTKASDEDDDDETPLPSPTLSSPPPILRAVPPPPPPGASARSKRQSMDMPRGAPPPPPPAPPAAQPREALRYGENESEDGDEEEEQPEYFHRPPAPSGPPLPIQQTPPTPTHFTLPPPPPPAPPSDYIPETLPRRSFGSGSRPSIDAARQPSSSSVAPARRSMDLNRPSTTSEYVARDVDLSEHSQWWKYPARIPPVFENRPRELTYELEENNITSRSGRVTITREIYVLFHDYSQTVVTVRWDRDDPANATPEQRHEPPPPHLRQDQLEEYHAKYSAKLYDGAVTRQNTVVGDGDAYTFIKELFTLVPNALKPVGNRSYGALVYANLANASVQQYDEIRPGDVVTFRNARFQGHRGGLHQKYSIEVGKPDHVAVVMDWDGTKKKVRVFEQGREKGKVKVDGFKVGDLKSGEVKVWRVVGREWVGWSS
ncbi:hypothetical protein BGX38DRAFT_1272576 [Terfezia claveryi]|nr:hypothetical protein BGX38DRAFT_1272576 [Terfezia claveryi]